MTSLKLAESPTNLTRNTGATCLSEDEYSNTSSVGSNREYTVSSPKNHTRNNSADSYCFGYETNAQTGSAEAAALSSETTHIMLSRLWWVRWLMWSEAQVNAHIYFEFQDPCTAFINMAGDVRHYMRNREREKREKGGQSYSYLQV